MGLISNGLNEQLNGLIGKCFSINRMLDRGMSLLMVRWKMPRTSELLHPILAHSITGDKFADAISDYQGQRDNESIYPSTPIGDKEYVVPLDFFLDYKKELMEFEDMIKDTIDQANEEGDLTTKVFLDKLLFNLVPYMAYATQLIDLFSQCGNNIFNLFVLDSNIDKYIKE